LKKVTKIEETRAKPKKKLRTAAYCRVSTDMDAQLESLETQKQHYESYIAARPDLVFAGLYFDEGITGTKKDKRPELMRLMKDCKAGKIDFVITKSISRFSRNTTDCLQLVRELLSLHIPIWFEKENIDTGAMESELLLSLLSSMAQDESSSISQNSKWSIQKRFESGTFKAGSVPYGYDWKDGKMTVNPSQAEIVKGIFSSLLSGKGMTAIAKDLNEKKIPSRRGGRWSESTLRGMVSNEKYTGDCLFQKTWTDSQFNRHHNHGEQTMYLCHNHHKAIISHEAFDAAQRLIRQHAAEKGIQSQNRKYQKRYPFSGRIFCGECGSVFRRRICSSNLNRYAVWSCQTHIRDKEQCSMKYIRDDEIKLSFVTMINKLVFSRRTILHPYAEALRSSSRDDALRRIQQIETDLAQSTEKRETLTKLMADGIISQAIYLKETNALRKEAGALRKEKETLSHSVTGKTSIASAAFELLRFTEKGVMLDSFDEELFEKFVSKIIVKSRNELIFSLKCGLDLTERI
jgi:site-specific DNA recombinase